MGPPSVVCIPISEFTIVPPTPEMKNTAKGAADGVREADAQIRDGAARAGAAAASGGVEGRAVRRLANGPDRSHDRGRDRRPALSRALPQAGHTIDRIADRRPRCPAHWPAGPSG